MTIPLQLAITDQPDHRAGGGGGEGEGGGGGGGEEEEGGGEDPLPHPDLPRIHFDFNIFPAHSAKDAPLGKPAGDKSPSYRQIQ